MSLLAIGAAFNQPWVLGFPTRLLAGDWPSWRTHLYWYVLLGCVLLAFGRSARSPYCPWMCPFGAAQDVVGLLGGAHRRRLPARSPFPWLKRGLVWLAVLLGLLYRSPGGASYEVFSAAFRGNGSGFQLAALLLCGLASVFVRRPFCHWACPTDVVERDLRPVRRGVLRRALWSRPAGRATWPRPLVSEAQGGLTLRRLRNWALHAVGIVCVLLLLGHLYNASRRTRRPCARAS